MKDKKVGRYYTEKDTNEWTLDKKTSDKELVVKSGELQGRKYQVFICDKKLSKTTRFQKGALAIVLTVFSMFTFLAIKNVRSLWEQAYSGKIRHRIKKIVEEKSPSTDSSRPSSLENPKSNTDKKTNCPPQPPLRYSPLQTEKKSQSTDSSPSSSPENPKSNNDERETSTKDISKSSATQQAAFKALMPQGSQDKFIIPDIDSDDGFLVDSDEETATLKSRTPTAEEIQEFQKLDFKDSVVTKKNFRNLVTKEMIAFMTPTQVFDALSKELFNEDQARYITPKHVSEIDFENLDFESVTTRDILREIFENKKNIQAIKPSSVPAALPLICWWNTRDLLPSQIMTEAAAKVMVENHKGYIPNILEKDSTWINSCSKKVMNLYFAFLSVENLQELGPDRISELEFSDDQEKNKNVVGNLHRLQNRHFEKRGDALRHLTPTQVLILLPSLKSYEGDLIPSQIMTEAVAKVIVDKCHYKIPDILAKDPNWINTCSKKVMNLYFAFLSFKNLQELGPDRISELEFSDDQEKNKNVVANLSSLQNRDFEKSGDALRHLTPAQVLILLPSMKGYTSHLLPSQIITEAAAKVMVDKYHYAIPGILAKDPNWINTCSKKVMNLYFAFLSFKNLQELGPDRIRELEFSDDQEKNKNVVANLSSLQNRDFEKSGDALRHLTPTQVLILLPFLKSYEGDLIPSQIMTEAVAKVIVDKCHYRIPGILAKDPNWINSCPKKVMNLYLPFVESSNLKELTKDTVCKIEFSDDKEINAKLLTKLWLCQNSHLQLGDALKHLTPEQVFVALRTESFDSSMVYYLTPEQISGINFDQLNCESEVIKKILEKR